MSRVSSPKICRQRRPSTPYTKVQGLTPFQRKSPLKSNSGVTIPQVLVSPPLPLPARSGDSCRAIAEDPFVDSGLLSIPNSETLDWDLDSPTGLSAREDRPPIASGTVPKRLASPSKAAGGACSERRPGLHTWLKSMLQYEGKKHMTPGSIIGCRICRKSMLDPNAHLHEHASKLWSAILLDEPMALRDIVLAVQFVVAQDMMAHEVFGQEENRAFAKFFWNYDSLEGLDESVKFSDDLDKDCIGPFKRRVRARAMKECSNPVYPCDLSRLCI